jgi:hypothetical protein
MTAGQLSFSIHLPLWQRRSRPFVDLFKALNILFRTVTLKYFKDPSNESSENTV